MPIASLNRTVFHLSGEKVESWLAGLLTNSLDREINFAALLTPQGKIIADMFVHKTADGFFLETPTKFAAELHKRLKLYRLRAPIEITATEKHVYAIWDQDEQDGLEDPRLPALGRRLISDAVIKGDGDYNAHRLSLGVPDSEWDFESSARFPADVNMDLLNGVNFSKGCFVGQEVVSRMKRMTTVRKRLRGIVLSDTAQAGDIIRAGEKKIGEVLHIHGTMGMALIRIDHFKNAAVDPTLNDTPVEIMNSVDGLDH